MEKKFRGFLHFLAWPVAEEVKDRGGGMNVVDGRGSQYS